MVKNTFGIGHNSPPMTLDDAQKLAKVTLRPSHVQRHCGPGSPLRQIAGIGELGSIGRWVLLACGHMREIRDYDLYPSMGRPKPRWARCGCCRLNYLANDDDVAEAKRLLTPEPK